MENKKTRNKKYNHFTQLKHRSTNFTFHSINKNFPQLSSILLKDLLQMDGYSDVAVGFGAGVGLDVIRKIATGNTCCVTKTTFFRILGLYAKVFCNWHELREDVM
jgi:hypothetical protein